jgi:hypothetical protein
MCGQRRRTKGSRATYITQTNPDTDKAHEPKLYKRELTKAHYVMLDEQPRRTVQSQHDRREPPGPTPVATSHPKIPAGKEQTTANEGGEHESREDPADRLGRPCCGRR